MYTINLQSCLVYFHICSAVVVLFFYSMNFPFSLPIGVRGNFFLMFMSFSNPVLRNWSCRKCANIKYVFCIFESLWPVPILWMCSLYFVSSEIHV